MGSGGSAPKQPEVFTVSEPMRKYTGPGEAPHFPPQQHASNYCTYPEVADLEDVRQAYQIWKDELLTSDGARGFLRVVRPDTPDGLPNSSVSEGIAYGMLLAAYLDDQDTFDALWNYSQEFADQDGLMQWYIDPTGEITCPMRDGACSAATDADEDMAWALLVADRQWGGGKSRVGDSYWNLAVEQIERIWAYEIEPGTLIVKPGNAWGGWNVTNPSYYAPAYYRVFAEVTDNPGWISVAEKSYDLIEKSLNEDNGNQENGLVPAWMNGRGEPVKAWEDTEREDGSVSVAPLHYQYDSARMPFRVAQDYCYFGAPRAKAYLDKVNDFFAEQGALGITDGYELDGTPRTEASMEGSDSAVFVAAAGVGAMADAERTEFVAQTYERLTDFEAVLVRSEYYQRSWTALGLLMMNGTFFDLTQYARPE